MSCCSIRRIAAAWEPPGDFGALAMPLDLALERLSSNPDFLALRQTYC